MQTTLREQSQIKMPVLVDRALLRLEELVLLGCRETQTSDFPMLSRDPSESTFTSDLS